MATAVYSPPGFPDIIYAGSRTGGVMKTTDRGVHWYSITDDLKLPGLGVTQILGGDPNNAGEIYVCTGFSAQGGDVPPTIGYGVGVLYSANGGVDWIQTSLSWTDYYIIGYNNDVPPAPIYGTGPVVNRMIKHPTDHNVLYALAGNKIYKTTDKWQTKTDISISIMPASTDSYSDIAILPNTVGGDKLIVSTFGGTETLYNTDPPHEAYAWRRVAAHLYTSTNGGTN